MASAMMARIQYFSGNTKTTFRLCRDLYARRLQQLLKFKRGVRARSRREYVIRSAVDQLCQQPGIVGTNRVVRSGQFLGQKSHQLYLFPAGQCRTSGGRSANEMTVSNISDCFQCRPPRLAKPIDLPYGNVRAGIQSRKPHSLLQLLHNPLRQFRVRGIFLLHDQFAFLVGVADRLQGGIECGPRHPAVRAIDEPFEP